MQALPPEVPAGSDILFEPTPAALWRSRNDSQTRQQLTARLWLMPTRETFCTGCCAPTFLTPTIVRVQV